MAIQARLGIAFKNEKPDAVAVMLSNNRMLAIVSLAEFRRLAKVLETLERNEEWTCGHVAGSMCAECYRILAQVAHGIAEENRELRDELKRKP